MRVVILLALVGACSDDNTVLRIERQPAPLSATTEDGWQPGSAVVVASPGALTFPQPVSLRITIVDPSSDDAMPKAIGSGSAALFGDTTATLTMPLVCQPTFCDAQVDVAAQGGVLVQLSATGADGTETDCFYYGVYEDADAATATAAHRDELEARQRECLNGALD